MNIHPFVIFVSSVQKELATERRALKTFIENDPLLHRFFTVFLFEDISACDRKADYVYLSEVERCSIYLGLFGNEYTGVFDKRETMKGKISGTYVND